VWRWVHAWVERHITLDRAMWGSDQAASVEPQGFAHLVRDIRLVETAMGDGVKRVIEREVTHHEKIAPHRYQRQRLVASFIQNESPQESHPFRS